MINSSIHSQSSDEDDSHKTGSVRCLCRNDWKQCTESKNFLAIWKGVQFIMTCFVMIDIPFRIAFKISSTWQWLIVDILVDILFLLDTLLFCVSAHAGTSKGFRYSTSKVRLQGLRSRRLFFDTLSILPVDYALDVSVLCGNELWKTFSRPYVSRLNRICRAIHLNEFVRYFREEMTMGASSLQLTYALALVAILVHNVACSYFLIIDLQSEILGEYTHGFIYENYKNLPHLANVTRIMDDPVHLQYCRSLFWSIATLTSYGDTDPETLIEIIYVILVCIIGIALFVTLIGIVGASLTNVDRSASQFEKKMDTIQQLLKLRDIPQTTAQRVLSFYFYLWNSRRVIDEDDLLSDLPSYLRKKIAREANRTILKKIKFLSECRESLLEDLMLCLKFHVALPGTIITHAGEKGKEMYFIASGCLDVFTGDDCYITTLEKGTFFGEMALFFNIARTATVVAKTHCDLYALSQDDFLRVLEDYQEERNRMYTEAQQRAQSMGIIPRQ